MTAKRLAAVVAAVVLIAVALVLRRTVLDDDPTSTAASTVPTTAPTTTAGELVCITELAAACRAVQPHFPSLVVRIQPAGTTLAALAAPDATAPMWATIQPYPAMVDGLRGTPTGATTIPLGASHLTIATPPGGRSSALTTGCATTPLWSCIGSHAGAPWTTLGGNASFRTIRPSLGAVDREAVALASFAAAVAGYYGTPAISATMWDADPAFISWLRRLSGVVDPSALSAGTPLATMATRAGALDIAATTDAEVVAIGSERFDVNYPQPSMWVEAVLAIPGGASIPDGLEEALRAEVGAAGWATASAATEPLPDATTMLALRDLWQQAT